MNNNNKIPTEEDFDRASKIMNAKFRGLDEASKVVLNQLKERCPLRRLFILPDGNDNFRVYVFYKNICDIALCERNGYQETIKKTVYDALEQFVPGRSTDISVVFEFDSEENVVENYEGDYFLRLR